MKIRLVSLMVPITVEDMHGCRMKGGGGIVGGGKVEIREA